MLSEKIAAAAAPFSDAQKRLDGLAFEPIGVIAMAAVLHALIDDARALERQVVPPAARLAPGDLPAGVAVFKPASKGA